jgi:hypothetical protein
MKKILIIFYLIFFILKNFSDPTYKIFAGNFLNIYTKDGNINDITFNSPRGIINCNGYFWTIENEGNSNILLRKFGEGIISSSFRLGCVWYCFYVTFACCKNKIAIADQNYGVYSFNIETNSFQREINFGGHIDGDKNIAKVSGINNIFFEEETDTLFLLEPNYIRKITNFGNFNNVTTIKGLNDYGSSDNPAMINYPNSILSINGTVYFTDNNKIRYFYDDGKNIVYTLTGISNTSMSSIKIDSNDPQQVSFYSPKVIINVGNRIYTLEYNFFIRSTNTKINPGSTSTFFQIPQGDNYYPVKFWYNETSHELYLPFKNVILIITELNDEEYYCFGFHYNVTNVCSGNGKCIIPNKCNCNSGYYNYDCSLYNCYNILFNNSNVCSGNGNCTSPNNCVCNLGYTNEQCYPICFSIPSNYSNVCSGKGNCYSPNNCNCNSGYYNYDCSLYNCYNILFNNSNVCSGNGNCTSPDNCVCNLGYTNEQCQHPICFSIPSNYSNVCSGKGNCYSPNNCTCNSGYYNYDCSLYSCYNILFNNSNVCSGKGNCYSPNDCTCNSGYYNYDCSLYNCYSILFNNSNVCSGKGNCISPNKCTCNSGYFSYDCSLYNCFNILFNNSNVCSGNGNCNSPDNCTCNLGYTYQFCQLSICFGIIATSMSVCSGNGNCVMANTCICNKGYEGSFCSIASNDISNLGTILGSIFGSIGGLSIFLFIFFIILFCYCFFVFLIIFLLFKFKKSKNKNTNNVFELEEKKNYTFTISEDSFKLEKNDFKIIKGLNFFFIFFINQFLKKLEIGGGTFSIVYKGIWNTQEVAIKMFKNLEILNDNEENLSFKKELELISKLRNPNIISFFGFMTEPNYAIILEFCKILFFIF